MGRLGRPDIFSFSFSSLSLIFLGYVPLHLLGEDSGEDRSNSSYNEELQATNEELLASNEELQSTNEELHSVNEELYSVNSEFERKNIELKQLNNDHENLLSSIDIGTVFLDRSLRIRKYNAAIASFFKLMPQDIGRPIDHIAYHLSHQELMLADIARVLQTGEPITAEEENRDKSWLLRKIMPFRTENGAIEGVVVTFTDITTVKAAALNVRRVNEELEEKVLERTAELKQEIQERLKAEADLALARDHYLSILDEAPALIWRANTDAQCDWFNHTWLAFTGRTIEEERGNGWAQGVHPDDLAPCVDTWLSSFGERKAFEMEYRLKRYDGEYRWILDIGRPYNQTDGSFAGYIGYCFDVTERRQTAKALKDSESNLRARLEAIASPEIDISTEDLVKIFDASAVQDMMDAFYSITQMGIGIIDLEGNVIVSTGWQRVCTDFYRRHPESLKNCLESDLALSKGVEQGKIKLYRCKNGMWDMVTPLIADDKHFANIFLGQFFFEDEVPDIETLESQARELEFDIESFRSALSEIPVWSRNRVHSTMTFYSRFASLIARQCVSSVKFAKSLELQRKTEEKLIQSQKVESIGRLAGGVAHDFNNMLGVILGHTELLLEQIEPESSVREDLLEIDKAAKRSADITRQLLAFARKQTIAPKLLDLNQALQPVLSIIQRLIGEDITLQYRPGADLWMVKIDPSQIDQIITNLATNARDAIPGVGFITVATQNKVISATETNKIPDASPGEYVVLSFIDDGEGIASDKISHIFDPFFTTKEVGKGSGLGLATVYGIARQNGGFIQVESKVGHGTAFHIYFPRSIESDPTFKDNDYKDLNGNETILIVEDEKSNLALLKRYLSSLGYHVLAASHPNEVTELVKTEKDIDLLLSDVVMPDTNGRELYDAISREILGLRCLYMSGYTAEIIEQRGVVADGVNFIQKPFELKDLAIKIKKVLCS